MRTFLHLGTLAIGAYATKKDDLLARINDVVLSDSRVTDAHTQQLDFAFIQRLTMKIQAETQLSDKVYSSIDTFLSQIAESEQNQHPLDTQENTFNGAFEFRAGSPPVVNHVPLVLKPIWGYGCWCNFGEDLLIGGGTPVDPYDEACHNLQMCLHCAIEDTWQETGEVCDPMYQEYNATFSWYEPNAGAIMGECGSSNGNEPCPMYLCSCELNLINNILILLWDATWADMTLRHDNGFNDSICYPGKQSGNGNARHAPADECCGFYPNRRTFRPGTSECCQDDQTLFKPNTQDCCPTVGVVSVGAC